MTRIEIDGLSLHVARAGHGPAVVLLHGFTGSGASWAPLVDAIAPQVTTIAVDLVGHGRSDAPAALDRYRMARAVADLAALPGRLGFERATWIGYSLGGRTALQVAAHHPAVVEALVIEGGTPGLADPAERAARVAADEALADRIEREGSAWFADHWGALPMWASQAQTLDDAQRAALRAGRAAQRAVGLANSLRGMGTGAQEPLHDRLAAIAVPTLLVTGALDEKFGAIAREMARTMPRAAHHEIPGAGHASHLERPEAFAALVREFLEAPRRAARAAGAAGDRA